MKLQDTHSLEWKLHNARMFSLIRDCVIDVYSLAVAKLMEIALFVMIVSTSEETDRD